MSGLRIILLEKLNISKNIYLTHTTCQVGLIQGHLNSNHIFEIKKMIALNVLLLRSFTNSDLLLT